MPSLLMLLALGGGPAAPPSVYAPTWDGMPGEHAHPHAHGPGGLQAPVDPALEGPDLRIPWPCGRVESCTQGHNGGSHTGNSAWAWDFAHQEGEEIWAVSAGVVTHLRMNMTDGGCDPAFASDANYITVDHGDGTSVVYVHMLPGSSPLAVGETVEVGDLVARIGATGYACGAHLHMQVMQTCGAYYCQSVPGQFADYGDPSANNQYESNNCPECSLALDGGQTVIDDEDAGCLVRQTTAWWSSYQGQGDHHFWTRAIDAGASESSAVWRFGVSVPGQYRVEVFVPDQDADTTGARYLVHDASGTTEVLVDQSTQKGWQDLGLFEFTGADGEGVELGDATGEAVALDRHIAYDAIRMTYEPVMGDSGGTSAGGTDGGSLDESGGATSAGGGTVGGTSAGSGPNTGSGPGPGGADGTIGSSGVIEPALPPGFGQGDDDGACACRASEGSTLPPWLWAVFLLGWRRRR